MQAIHDRGGKVTPQRLMIYQSLADDPTHPTAEAVYERIRATLPTISLTTVYKTLNELVAMGELRRFDTHGVSHFDPNTDPHAEIVCLTCGSIVDVAYSPQPTPPPVLGFHIIGQSQTFYGYCSACADGEAGSGD